MSDLQASLDAEVRLMGRSNSRMLVEKCKDEREMKLSALMVLEVFERAGNTINQYLQSDAYNRCFQQHPWFKVQPQDQERFSRWCRVIRNGVALGFLYLNQRLYQMFYGGAYGGFYLRGRYQQDGKTCLISVLLT
ncbi:hypothetical protein V6N13_085755 [Hibiscus sabdariffa]|uniref:Uncharacterized protein n=1 Tax=Hibiscus sabdariffa TaxID=183260 RepID=A0ABR2FR43_9ROSI